MPRDTHSNRLRLGLTAVAFFAAIIIGASMIFEQKEDATNSREDHHNIFSPLIGQHRSGFVLPDLTGKPRTLNEWDQRILVINFWATWCKPCRRELPLFTRLQQQYGELGLQFIGIAIDDTGTVKDFISDLTTPINYPILVGGDDAITIAKQYGNEFGILPYSVILDRSGKITYIQYGEFPRSNIEQEISALL